MQWWDHVIAVRLAVGNGILVSDASSYINGQIIPVNGGRNMLRG